MNSDEENKKLRDKIKELEKVLEKEREEKDKIVNEKKKLEKEFEEFKAKHKQTVTNLRKALKIKPDKKKKPKPVGAKNGHKAYTNNSVTTINVLENKYIFRLIKNIFFIYKLRNLGYYS